MKVVVIGASRGTGRLLVDELVRAGHEVRAMIRDPDQEAELRAAGASPVAGDLEVEVAAAIDGVDAVAFCAGSGSRTGPDATLRVDLLGAVRTVDACVELGVRRYVMLSSMGARDPMRGRESIRHYLAAKHAADRILEASELDATIVRPGGLVNEPGTGRIEVGVPTLDRRGAIPRADVAAVMSRCFVEPATIGAAFEVLAGDEPIDSALGAL